MTIERACPECGESKYLYKREALRWQPDRHTWESCGGAGDVDCSECDWVGYESETLKTGDSPDA